MTALARRRTTAVHLAMLAPATLLAVVFFAIPIGMVLYQSFTNTPLIGSGTWVGIDNYVRLVTDETFLASMQFGLVYTLIASLIVVVSAYLLGVLVRATRPLAGVFRGLYLVPFVIGLTTLSYAALLEFRPGYGAFNQVLALAGLGDGNTPWLLNPATAVWAVALVTGIGSVGFAMILFMTAMQSVPTELIEAAKVDGTNWFQRERLVILPMIRATFALVTITTIAGGLLVFTQFFILTQGGPGSATATPVLVIYKTAVQQFRLGAASAMSVTLLIIIAILTAVQLFLLRRRNEH
jgi:multiple sugar transport system permease protein